jgi:cell division protein FtsB
MAAIKQRRKITRQLVSRLAEHEHGFKRKTIRLGIGIAVLYVAYLFCAGDYGLLRIYRLYNECDRLDAEYRTIVAEAVDYSYSLGRMRSDPLFVEWLARTRYGYSRPEETIYHLKFVTEKNGHP